MFSRLPPTALVFAAVVWSGCQVYHLEEVDSQTIVAIETFQRFERVAPPTLLVLQDRSASMDACFDPAGGLGPTSGCKELPNLQSTDPDRRSRMEVARQVMIKSVYASREDVEFGLILFGADDESPTCGLPQVISNADETSWGEVIESYERHPFLVRPAGGTPTTAALRQAYELLVDPTTNEPFRDDRHNFIVLVTDGLMNCNADHSMPCLCASEGGCTAEGGGTLEFGERGTPTTAIQCLDDHGAEAEVARLAAAGVRTFVVGLGEVFGDADNTLATDVLDRLAVAGGAPKADGDHQFYSAGDPEELQSSIERIARQIAAPCAYQLEGPVCDGRLLQVVLRIDGERIETSCSDDAAPETWFFNADAGGSLDPSVITFSPDLCERLDVAESVEVSLRGLEAGCGHFGGDGEGAPIQAQPSCAPVAQ